MDPSGGQDGIVRALESLLGGGAMSVIAATMGRLMYHAEEVKRHRRKFFGWEMLWEIPVIIGMGIIGEGVAAYFDVSSPVSTSIIAVMSYYGPRGCEWVIDLLSKRIR